MTPFNKVTLGFEKVRSSIIKQSKKQRLDKRLRLKLKRRFSKAGAGSGGAILRAGPNGTIIGRPKKPPIIGSEKTDGMLFKILIIIEAGTKIYTCHVLGCGKIF